MPVFTVILNQYEVKSKSFLAPCLRMARIVVESSDVLSAVYWLRAELDTASDEGYDERRLLSTKSK
jgi:hypothetical protein